MRSGAFARVISSPKWTGALWPCRRCPVRLLCQRKPASSLSSRSPAMLSRLLTAFGLLFCWCGLSSAADPWVVYEGGDGPGKGKHLVLIAGDDEYHSEEAMPQLGKVLARHHGF